MLHFERETIKSIFVLRVQGRLDLEGHPYLHRELEWLVKNGETKVVINLKEVTVISSSGAGALVALYQQLEKVQGVLALVELSKACREVLELLRLTDLFTIYDTEAQALNSLAG